MINGQPSGYDHLQEETHVPGSWLDSPDLFFQGNGEIVADYDDIAPCLVDLGASFLPVDCRG
jgi:hypothetical protein